MGASLSRLRVATPKDTQFSLLSQFLLALVLSASVELFSRNYLVPGTTVSAFSATAAVVMVSAYLGRWVALPGILLGVASVYLGPDTDWIALCSTLTGHLTVFLAVVALRPELEQMQAQSSPTRHIFTRIVPCVLTLALTHAGFVTAAQVLPGAVSASFWMSHYWQVAMGVLTGVIVGLPPLVALVLDFSSTRTTREVRQFVLLMAGVILAMGLLKQFEAADKLSPLYAGYLFYPAIIWVAFQHRALEVMLVTALVQVFIMHSVLTAAPDGSVSDHAEMLLRVAFAIATALTALTAMLANQAKDRSMQLVAKNDKLLRSVLNNLYEGVVVRERDGRWLILNDSARRILRIRDDESGDPERLKALCWHIVNEHGETIGHSTSPVSYALEQGKPMHDTVFGIVRGADTQWLRFNIQLLTREGEAEPYAGLSTFTDISEKKSSLEQARIAELMVSNTLNALVLMDAQANIRRVNPAFTRMTGYQAEEVIGRSLRFLSVDQSLDLRNILEQLRNGESHWQGEVPILDHEGREHIVFASVSAIRDDSGPDQGYVAVLTDVTMQKEAESRIRHLATHDPLTGLGNRALFNETLQRAVEENQGSKQRFALLFIDLDKFKRVNDTFGHAAGDELLVNVARRLRSVVRGTDFVARLAGDEFAVILRRVRSMDELSTVTERICGELAEPYQLREAGDREVVVTASIGVSIFPDQGVTPAELLRNSDHAMYSVKRETRNGVRVFSEDLDNDVFESLLMESALRQAVRNNELDLHFQPQVDLKTRELVGLECLLRWYHPELGQVPPGVFIPLAEDSGLILEIGDWVLKQVCRYAAKWRAAGFAPVRFAFNVSALQFYEETLAEKIEQALRSSGVPAGMLDIEITESAVMQRPEQAAQTLRRLKDIGVRLSVDDFGTGYSCMAYLNLFPLDAIKVDRRFVHDVQSNPQHQAISRAIASLGEALGMKVVAEGVESEEEALTLLRIGCHEGQGFHFARPLHWEALIARQLGMELPPEHDVDPNQDPEVEL